MTKRRTANLLGALANEIAARLEDQLKRHPNQTDSSAAALNNIRFYEGCTNLRLSQILKLSHTATVRLVDKLERDGLVESKPGTDRRTVALSLTAAGQARTQDMLKQRLDLLTQFVDLLTPSQQTQLAAIAKTLLCKFPDNEQDAEHICRLCDERVCPLDECPLNIASKSWAPAEK